jgi:acyl-CoA thioesterase FadM
MLEVELTLEQLKEKSAKLGFTVTNKETAELLATGYFVVVAADKNTGKAKQIPKEFVDKLKPFAKQIL